MIRHILFWKLKEEFRVGSTKQQALQVLCNSVQTLKTIPGLRCAEIGENLAGGDYDLVFYTAFDDLSALKAFQEHPLHVAHRTRCAPYVTGRLAGDLHTVDNVNA